MNEVIQVFQTEKQIVSIQRQTELSYLSCNVFFFFLGQNCVTVHT